jgi:hypothetical protein
MEPRVDVGGDQVTPLKRKKGKKTQAEVEMEQLVNKYY